MKRHQRIVAMLLVTASLSAPGVALADKMASEQPSPTAGITASLMKVSQAQAVEIAKSLFKIPAELGEPNVGFSQSKEFTVWRLDWRTADKKAPQVGISVEVDASTGKVRSYGRSSNKDAKAPLTYTRTEAKTLADQWLDKLGAQLKSSVRYRELNDPFYYGGVNASYTFHWDRMEQGYPVQGEGLDIVVDARTGELERYSVSWNESGLTYTLPKEIIDQAKADAVYRSQLPMMLQYQRFVKPGTEEARWQLIYRPVTGFYPMVSVDGKLVNSSQTVIDMAQYKDLRTVPVPIVPYKKPAQPLTRDEALKLARQVSGQTGEPNSSNYSEYGDKTKQRVWDFSWTVPGDVKGTERYTNVRIDAERGVVLGLNNWKGGGYEPLKEGEEPKVTLEQARQNALGLMLLFRPDLGGAAQLQPSMDDAFLRVKMGGRPSTYYLNFTHLYNGTPMSDASSSITIDARTGDVIGFSSWENRSEKDEFPKAEGLIGADKAMDALLKQQPLQLVWTTIYNPALPGVKEAAPTDTQGPTTALIWAPAMSNVTGIDAKAGVPLDGSGRDLIEAAKRPNDIEGHFAQREIELLWARGVFELKDGKFNPGQSISVEELARWLVLAKGMQPYPMFDFRGAFGLAGEAKADALSHSVNAGYFGAAFQTGIFVPEDFTESMDLTAQVTREQLALWAVRAMGYGSIAKMENKVDMSFTDRSEIDGKYANAVAILQGLGMVKGNGAGQFAPKRLLSRGEAAKILFSITAEPRR